MRRRTNVERRVRARVQQEKKFFVGSARTQTRRRRRRSQLLEVGAGPNKIWEGFISVIMHSPPSYMPSRGKKKKREIFFSRRCRTATEKEKESGVQLRVRLAHKTPSHHQQHLSVWQERKLWALFCHWGLF
jgi:hypothetical protein